MMLQRRIVIGRSHRQLFASKPQHEDPRHGQHLPPIRHQALQSTLRSMSKSFFLSLFVSVQICQSFVPTTIRPVFIGAPRSCLAHSTLPPRRRARCIVFSGNDDQGDVEGSNLAAEFLRIAQSKGISLDTADLEYDGEEDFEDDGEDDSLDDPIPREEMEGDPTLTDDKIFSEIKERVLDTAGGFVKYVQDVQIDDEDDADENETDEASKEEEPSKPYVPPEKVPDPDLTAGEVVSLVLAAFRNNDNPTPNRGVEIFFAFSSAGSQVKTEAGLTPTEYASYLKETEYNVLFTHTESVIEKGDYSFDGRKAFFTAYIQTGPRLLDRLAVNFVLSTSGNGENTAWLIDSMLIRPGSMRRNRRR